MKRRPILLSVGTAMLGAVVAVTSAMPVSAAATQGYGSYPTGLGGGPIAQNVLGSGSDTTQLMMNSLDGLYQFSPGCDQLAPAGTTQWLDFSCGPDSNSATPVVQTENYAHDQVHEAYFLGSSNGISQLCTQGSSGVAHIDFARSSRKNKSTDCTGAHFVAYARDGISWEAFPGVSGAGLANQSNASAPCTVGVNPRYCLTQAQLNGIFVTCSITNWNQVGGQNVPISIYTAQPGSGTRSAFDGFVGGDSSHCIAPADLTSHQIPENSNSGIPSTDRVGAIFPFSYGVFQTTVAPTVGKAGSVNFGAKLGQVDDVPPTVTTIGNLTFPYGRYLYNIFCATCSAGNATQATTNYVGEEGWICKSSSLHATNPATGNNFHADIVNAISKAGFVPLPNGVIGGGDTNSDFCRLVVT